MPVPARHESVASAQVMLNHVASNATIPVADVAGNADRSEATLTSNAGSAQHNHNSRPLSAGASRQPQHVHQQGSLQGGRIAVYVPARVSTSGHRIAANPLLVRQRTVGVSMPRPPDAASSATNLLATGPDAHVPSAERSSSNGSTAAIVAAVAASAAALRGVASKQRALPAFQPPSLKIQANDAEGSSTRPVTPADGHVGTTAVARLRNGVNESHLQAAGLQQADSGAPSATHSSVSQPRQRSFAAARGAAAVTALRQKDGAVDIHVVPVSGVASALTQLPKTVPFDADALVGLRA